MNLCKWICCVSILSLPVLASAKEEQFSTPGELSLQGEIIESACTIEYQHSEQWIDFGHLTARDIIRQSGNNLVLPFQIRLADCNLVSQEYPSLFYHRINITFNSDKSDSNTQLIYITGDAKGFGIRLSDINGKILTLGEPAPDYDLVNGQNTLNFTATIVPVSKNVRSGDFYATVHFFMDYL